MNYIYNSSFFNSSLKHFAEAYLIALPADVTCLVSRGSSGCTICSAMLALSDNEELHHVYIKSKEESYHSLLGGNLDEHTEIIAIVDDFAGTGHTIEVLREWLAARGARAKYILLHHGKLRVKPGEERIITVEREV